MKKILALGSFDVLHVGHIHFLKRAAAMGDSLIVGIASDALYLSYKKKDAIFSEKDRASIISAIKDVDEVFIHDKLDLTECIIKYKPEVLVLGKDWEGKLDDFSELCTIVFLDRTDFVSSSEIKKKIKHL